MPSPINTTDLHREHLEMSRATGIPAGSIVSGAAIEAQEARGQREIVNSTVLPYPTDKNDERFIELGFTFGEQVQGDEMFREATLPEGWTRDGTEHSMHSVIRDEQGYERVGIFYKAAFYDRRADMHIIRVPKTKAQRDAWETVADSIGYRNNDGPKLWRSGEDRREGDNYVYAYNGRYRKSV